MSIFKKFLTRKQEKLNHRRQLRRDELFLGIREVVAKELKVEDKEKIKPTSRFKEDLNVDSLSTIELIMGLEDEFGIEILDEEAEKLLTIEDAIDYLEKKI
ncbi:MAG: acyl carrier protein [Candidatus Omnitrophica bacterium]|nr:acyl carrier protein [Candidatus Omnitrophota bacterium]